MASRKERLQRQAARLSQRTVSADAEGLATSSAPSSTDVFVERLVYYFGRDIALRRAYGRSISLVILSGALVAALLIPVHVSPSTARSVGVPGAIVSALMLAWLIIANTKGTAQSGRMEDLANQILQEDKFLREKQDVEDDSIVRAQAYFDEKFGTVGPVFVRLAKEDGIYPVRFPLNETAARGARMAVREIRAGQTRVSVSMFPLVSLTLIAMLTLAFMAAWGADPQALQGLHSHPPISDFVYLTLNSIVANMPPDITAVTQVSHAIFVGSFFSGVILISIYLAPAAQRLREDMVAVPAKWSGE